MTEIRHIVFDIGKVLIHYDPEIPFRRIIADDRRRAWFLSEVCSPQWNVEQDRGRNWQDAEMELIDRFPDEADNIRAFRQNWNEMVPYAYERSVAILQQLLSDGHDVTMLTNFASDTFREAQAKYPFLVASRGVTVSGDIGIIKPDPAIYARHTKDFGLEAAATLFIDDSEKNVIAAREFGWSAVLFEDAEGLVRDLSDRGIAVD
ncbi:HAD family hydrolase [Oricola sp.]|uniref:HAD family hydrolase n=1 Tax=Oricola sp. TaxID=1979950 RepID=UPI003BA8484A